MELPYGKDYLPAPGPLCEHIAGKPRTETQVCGEEEPREFIYLGCSGELSRKHHGLSGSHSQVLLRIQYTPYYEFN